MAPSLADYVERIGGNFGRVRVIKLNPSDEAAALHQLHLDDNNRLNPTEGMGGPVLARAGQRGRAIDVHPARGKDDPATETRIRLHPGMQLVIDTQRLYHVVWHPGPRPRYALITSWESDDVVDGWIKREMASRAHAGGQRAMATARQGGHGPQAGPNAADVGTLAASRHTRAQRRALAAQARGAGRE